jgi:hypothetical protein
LSDAAIFLALDSLKTPRFRSSASLSRVTRCDQRFGDDFFAVVVRLLLRAAVFRGRVVFRRSAMVCSISCFTENGRLDRSVPLSFFELR